MHEPFEMHTTQTPDACADLKLAQAYIPMQRFDGVFAPEEALRKGTLFPSLYQPYRRTV